VAQEALCNAARHGHARQVALELSLEPQGLCLTVTDDGCGFDPATVQPRTDSGLGVIGMRERVEMVGGRFDVISAPGSGTQVVATVPLAAPGSPAGAEER
jgi:signal transduction histidine kinase